MDTSIGKRFEFYRHCTCGNRIDFLKDQVTLLIYRVDGNRNRLSRPGLIFQNLDSDKPAQAKQSQGAAVVTPVKRCFVRSFVFNVMM